MSVTTATQPVEGGPATPVEPDLEDDETESAFERAAGYLRERRRDLKRQVARNLAAGAVMLLVTLLIVLLAALVGGEFAGAIPSDSVFNSAINTMTDNAGTAFTIFGVSLLAIPAVSVLAYIVTRLGPFIGGGLGGGTGQQLMRRR
jgi:cell division protein FtsX